MLARQPETPASGIGGGAWRDADTTIDSQISLVNQPRGKHIEYRITAVKKAVKRSKIRTD